METPERQSDPPMPDPGLRKVLPIAAVAALLAAGITFYATHNGVISTDGVEALRGAVESPRCPVAPSNAAGLEPAAAALHEPGMSQEDAADISYCDDSALAYAAALRRYRPGETLRFDASYRLAHLPLVALSHPAALRSAAGTDYQDGRYAAARHSLVVPVSSRELAASAAFQAVDAALRTSCIAPKIAFDLCERRAAKLHVTLGSAARSELERHADTVATVLSSLGALRFTLRGPFMGSKNTGRIYFPAYPECRNGDEVFALVQDALGVPRTRFYVLGYYNLVDVLDAAETAALQEIVDAWSAVDMLQVQADACLIQATNDDLVLSGRAVIRIDARPVAGG